MKALVLVAALAAPFQCASDPDPEHRLEDTPSEALWDLAERLENEGHRAARHSTLEQLIARYPGSREAQRARDELGVGSPTESEAEGEAAAADEAP